MEKWKFYYVNLSLEVELKFWSIVFAIQLLYIFGFLVLVCSYI